MKIVFTGGGTGGHFYPIIAIAEELNTLITERKLVDVELYFFSTEPYDERALFEQKLEFIKIPAGKWRRYFSLKNFIDAPKIGLGLLSALSRLYFLYPDVVFSKGGYASLPTVWAARLLRIPVFIHESDARPGRVNRWAGRFAKRIALAHETAKQHFSKVKNDETMAVTGNPIRRALHYPLHEGGREFLGLDPERPVIFVTGGSQGAAIINDIVLDILPSLLKHYAIIHQVGKDNLENVRLRSQTVLEKNENSVHYKLFDLLNESALRMVAGVSSLAIARAGSFIFELALWGLPAILIPIPESISHDQRSNAFTYARSGGAVVIEQNNLLPAVLLSEINRLLSAPEILHQMAKGAKSFAKPEAGRLIAEELVNIALSHEK